MGYRQVVITKAKKIRNEKNQLLIEKDGSPTIKIPLEDINFILIEDSYTSITTNFLAKLGEYGICLLATDEHHEPVSIMYPFNYHFKQLENLEFQLNMKQELKEDLVKQIIEAKIKNEILVLEKNLTDIPNIDKLYTYIKEVEPGDKTNREGLAAKVYFRALFGSDFIRFYDDGINKALNYAYTIVKSAIVRALAVFGLNTYLGLNHKSKVNNFNLAYDLIEPYRAIIDDYVYLKKETFQNELTLDNRKYLINILNIPILMDNKKYTIIYSIDLIIKSYINILKKGEGELLVPKLIV